MSAVLEAPDEAAALELLHAEGCTDGLPVVIPTPERVDRLVLASGLDADVVVGTVGPNLGVATVEKVAVNAVMAGCLPDHMPVVLAAVRAVCRPEFDTSEWQSTTHAISPLIVVNGPARDACGPLAHGFGALGTGHRANASIGRAVRLVLTNIGGAHPGITDMALLGQPGKFAMVLAEDEDASPFPPLHTSLDPTLGPADSAVTLLGVEGPHSVLSVSDADDPTSAQRLLRSLAATIANVGSNNAHFRRGGVAVVLNPDHAAVLAGAGLSRADIRQQLHELAANPRSVLHQLNPAFAPRAGDDLVRATASPEDILLLQGGGAGLYSVVFPSWGAGPHANPWVVERIELDQVCELPWASAP